MGNDYKKWLARTLDKAAAAGWGSKYNGKHVMVFPADKTQVPVTLATTSNDPTTIANQTARLRRAGLEL